jgi:hypothetical protein
LIAAKHDIPLQLKNDGNATKNIQQARKLRTATAAFKREEVERAIGSLAQ